MKVLKRLILYSCLGFLTLIFFLPVLFTVTNSFMGSHEAEIRYTSEVNAYNCFNSENNMHFVEPTLIPDKVSLSQYFNLFFKEPTYLGAFLNSLKITLPVVLGQLIIGISAAYGLEQLKFKYKEVLYFLYIVVMFMPLQVTLVPNYITVNFLNIDGGFLAIILPGIFSPFSVFLFRQYLKAVPNEYVEAAKMEGTSHFKILRLIIAPLLKPAFAAVAVLSFTSYWNIVEQAIIFLKNTYDEPLSVYISRISTENIGLIFAASCFYMLPSLFIFLYGKEYLEKGIANSAIK